MEYKLRYFFFFYLNHKVKRTALIEKKKKSNTFKLNYLSKYKVLFGNLCVTKVIFLFFFLLKNGKHVVRVQT